MGWRALLLTLLAGCARDQGDSGSAPATGSIAEPAQVHVEPASDRIDVAAPIAGLPPGCSAHVTMGGDAPTWEACASGRAGCDVATGHLGGADGMLDGDRIGFTRPEPVRLVGGAPHLAFTRTAKEPERGGVTREVHVLTPLEGPAVMTVSRDADPSDGCPVRLLFGEGGAGILALSSSRPGERYVASATWDRPHAFTVRATALGEIGGGPATRLGRAAIGDGSILLERRDPDGVVMMEASTGTLSLPAGPPVELALAFAGGYVGLHTGPGGGVALWPSGRGPGVIGAGAGRVVTAVAVDRSARQRLVWVESEVHGDELGPSVLVTADVTSDDAEVTRLHPGVVLLESTLDLSRGDVVSNDGLVLAVTSPREAVIIRLDDGSTRRLAPEPGTAFVRPLWIEDTRAWLSTARVSEDGKLSLESGVVRLSTLSAGAAP